MRTIIAPAALAILLAGPGCATAGLRDLTLGSDSRLCPRVMR